MQRKQPVATVRLLKVKRANCKKALVSFAFAVLGQSDVKLTPGSPDYVHFVSLDTTQRLRVQAVGQHRHEAGRSRRQLKL